MPLQGNTSITRAQRIGLLGGTFNPAHIGHLRFALELAELVRSDRFLLMPSASPPHKSTGNLLPFELRCRLLEAAIADLAPLALCRLEGERNGPSYTWDTLGLLKERHPGAEIFFGLGCEDFPQLPSWKNGPRLPLRAHLCIVPRGAGDEELFLSTARDIWPNALPCPPLDGARHTFLIAEGNDARGRVSYFDIPLLPVSATRLRERWLAGKDVRLLLPEAELALLEAERPPIAAVWGGRAPEAACISR